MTSTNNNAKYYVFNHPFNSMAHIQDFIRNKMKLIKECTYPFDENFDFLFELLLLHNGKLNHPEHFVKDNIDCFHTYTNQYLHNCIEVIYRDRSSKSIITNIQKLLSNKYKTSIDTGRRIL